MSYPHASPRVRLLLRLTLALILALAVEAAWLDTAAAHDPPPHATQPTSQQPEPTDTPTLEPTPTKTPKPTATPSPTATPTPLPAQDVAVSFFNNFCEAGQPLLATIFNTSATPLQARTLHLSLYGEAGLLEEHDHVLSLEPFGTTNLPLSNPASPPWVRIEIQLVEGVADPNPANDSASCGVEAIAAVEPTQATGGSVEDFDLDLSPGSSSRSAPPPASGINSGSVWHQAEPTPTPTEPAVQPTLAPLTVPSSSRPIANVPQPSLTPIGDAGGGLAPEPKQGFPSRTLLMTGVVLLAAGSSWAFYYVTRPPRGA